MKTTCGLDMISKTRVVFIKVFKSNARDEFIYF